MGSLPCFLISATTGDSIARIARRNGVVAGLLIPVTGNALCWLAAGAGCFQDRLPRIGEGIPRLGTSEAVAIVAYAWNPEAEV